MSNKKIVIADDVELFLMFEKTVFNRKDFELIAARDGRAIIKVIREVKPALVFMNLYMPEMDGDECCRIVKSDETIHDIPVIMIIRSATREEMEKCRRSGCDDILTKPLNRNDFMAATHKFLSYIERANQRFNARLPISYSDMSRENFIGYSIDLSTGGMFLETRHPLMVNTRLNIEFNLPANDFLIRCSARGAWVNDPVQPQKPDLPTGMGVQFLNISQADMNAIRIFIDSESGKNIHGNIKRSFMI